MLGELCRELWQSQWHGNISVMPRQYCGCSVVAAYLPWRNAQADPALFHNVSVLAPLPAYVDAQHGGALPDTWWVHAMFLMRGVSCDV